MALEDMLVRDSGTEVFKRKAASLNAKDVQDSLLLPMVKLGGR